MQEYANIYGAIKPLLWHLFTSYHLFEVVYPWVCHNALFVLYVSVQPADSDIQISLVHGDLTEGDVVTASCTVNRLYPEITSVGSFSITWGENTNSNYKKHDPVSADKAFKYTVTMTKTLNSSDNGTTIQCDLQPEIGTSVQQKKTVTVKCKYKVPHHVTSCINKNLTKTC